MIQFFKKKILKNSKKRKAKDFFLLYTFCLAIILIGVVIYSLGFLLKNIDIVLSPGKPRPENIPFFNFAEFEKIQKEW